MIEMFSRKIYARWIRKVEFKNLITFDISSEKLLSLLILIIIILYYINYYETSQSNGRISYDEIYSRFHIHSRIKSSMVQIRHVLPYVSLYSCIEIIKRIIKRRIEKICLTLFNTVPAVKFYSSLLTMYVDLYNNKIWIFFKRVEYKREIWNLSISSLALIQRNEFGECRSWIDRYERIIEIEVER